MKFKFGDIVENRWASKRNPTRMGVFVREKDGGRIIELTDMKGHFWELYMDSETSKIKRIGTMCPTDVLLYPPTTGEQDD